MIIDQLLQYAFNILKKNKISNYQLEANLLISFILNKPKSWIYGFNETKINYKQYKTLKNLLKKRIKGTPIAYILGFCEFWSLKINVSPYVLIPRKDTEILVDVVLQKINKRIKKILDLGTGSGAISLALAYEYNILDITAIDFSNKIINIAKNNAKNLNIKNITFLKSNWFSHLKNNTFDIIISNPPYISYKEYFFLKKQLKFEPIQSLVSNKNGLNDLDHIISNALKYLNNYGWLILEHGYKQGFIIKNKLKIQKFKNIQQYYDIQGYQRIICGQKLL
ncbi:peptide chain release factor N(5)-glutamine methyltransferase [Enterobacteriaceae endosymbiont of Donacia cincticornis]|uniref:peptide chain release factor N(5)-glutamine methyltransferase n=1 Tax=Enterobacteriaceae endosymbiont of Donacia cincticornis TaxID=2675773 RepID=UPI00144970EF|nr:peptide chain release factor N(5)-glutamine methyltransferase [Enterobacteriaceae endosymbiont of Donacia cincticornis]QJC35998.1 peptide chain release factor N(5)-glutamine methyltransferase [Enterobacteriaceae endosymbiont of Donacia cincticornis]